MTAAAALRHPIKTSLIVIVGLAAAYGTGRFLYHYFRYESTDDAYLSGHVHQVSPQIAGQVLEVLAHENETVKAGQPLVRIDPQEYRIGVAKAEAALAQARGNAAQARAGSGQSAARLAQAQAKAAEAQAQLAQAQAQHSLAGSNLQRSEQLSTGEDRAVTAADLDTARSTAAAAQASVRAAAASVTAAQADVKAAEAEKEAVIAQVQAADAAVALAQASLEDARRKLGYATVTAPADGRIGNKNVEAGNRVQPGQTLMVLVEPQVWIEANFKETQIAKMHLGEAVEVQIDAIPGRSFAGHVASFAPATGAQFALLPADNATGNFTKVVQRVPVRIELDAGALNGYQDRVSPGLSATVDVDLHG